MAVVIDLGKVLVLMMMLFMNVIPKPEPTNTPNPRMVQTASPVRLRAHMARPATWRVVARAATQAWESFFRRRLTEKPAVFMKIVRQLTVRQFSLG